MRRELLAPASKNSCRDIRSYFDVVVYFPAVTKWLRGKFTLERKMERLRVA
jgi:hypothetical protein